MARRYDVAGVGGLRLTAWEYAAGPVAATVPHPAGPGGEGRVGGPAGSGRGAGAVAPGPGGSTGPGGGCRRKGRERPEPSRGPSGLGGAGDASGPGGPSPAADPSAGPSEASAERPGMLLLHGLLGHTSHWTETARRLSPRYRVISLDQRGHGQKCSPASYTEESYVQDALAAVEQLGLAPAVLVGHGTGALTAWACAASRPDLVAAVVVCEMRAAAVGESMQRSWAQWFESWPLPFASLGEVRAYFGGQEPCPGLPPSVSSEFFAQMMARTEDGWRPPHAAEHLLRSQDAWIAEPHWDELANVRCPALVVRGVEGLLGRAEAQEMVRVLPRGSYAEIPDAGHLAPWEHPEAWCDAIEGFLTTALEPQPGPCPV